MPDLAHVRRDAAAIAREVGHPRHGLHHLFQLPRIQRERKQRPILRKAREKPLTEQPDEFVLTLAQCVPALGNQFGLDDRLFPLARRCTGSASAAPSRRRLTCVNCSDPRPLGWSALAGVVTLPRAATDRPFRMETT